MAAKTLSSAATKNKTNKTGKAKVEKSAPVKKSAPASAKKTPTKAPKAVKPLASAAKVKPVPVKTNPKTKAAPVSKAVKTAPKKGNAPAGKPAAKTAAPSTTKAPAPKRSKPVVKSPATLPKKATAKVPAKAPGKIRVKKIAASAPKPAMKKPVVKKAPARVAPVKIAYVKPAAPKRKPVKHQPIPVKKGSAAAADKVGTGSVVYSKEELEYFRKIILEKVRDAEEEIMSIEERLLDTSTGEFNDDDATYSLHMADQGTDAMEREKAFLFAARERKFISHLSDALQRINSGNYGVCIHCTNLIEKGRLEAVPHARMCVNCKNKTKNE